MAGQDNEAKGPDPFAVVPRPAATVMVVRDGSHADAPLEVLMVRRSLSADFVGGAYVFPGGAVDAADSGPRVERLCRGLTDGAASSAIGVGSRGLAFWVAAVRECFEEAGLLLACHADGAAVSFTDPDVARRFARARDALNAGERSFLDVCELEGLWLCVDEVHFFAHWITPEGARRRYDTRFFVAAAPESQTPAHDDGETISAVWVRPAEALERHRAGGMQLILPTIRNLQAIGRFSTAGELLAAAARGGDVPTVLPRLVADGGGARLLLPGDPGYDDPGIPGISAGDLAGLEIEFDAATRLASLRANTPEVPESSGAAGPVAEDRVENADANAAAHGRPRG